MANFKLKNILAMGLMMGVLGGTPNLFAEEKLYQTGETSSIEFKKEIPVLSFLVGGGGNVVVSNSNIIDTIAGGGVKTRITFQDFISIESSLDFNRFPIQNADSGTYDISPFSSDVKGDLFSIPFLHMVLIHTPLWNNMSFYGGGGVGYQFNDAKGFNVNVNLGSVPVGTLKAEVEDGLIGAAGGGVDLRLSDHLLLNFDVRYQFAEFEVEQTGVVAGTRVRIVEKEEHFDTVVIRTGLLYRF